MTDLSGTSADRRTRHRARQRAGVLVVSVEVDREARAGLVDYRLVSADDVGDREEIRAGVEALLYGVSVGAIEIDVDKLD